jgi:hypothetical protein
VEKLKQDQYVWTVSGQIPARGWRGRAARFLLGPRFTYRALFCGGNIVSITYGVGARFRGRPQGWRLPAVHVLWGCTPHENGTSTAAIFIVQRARTGLWGKIRSTAQHILSLALLIVLRDDDIKAFPHMRFDPQNLIEQDRSASLLIHHLDKTKVSPWSFVR